MSFKGFRMTVGSPTTTTLAEAKAHIGLRYNCLQTLINRGPEMADFPDKPCPAGIFAVHHFPALVILAALKLQVYADRL